MLARVRSLIAKAIPGVAEEWKWNVPVWSGPAGGIICTGETYKNIVKLTFARGASLPDPHGLFNSSLGGNTRRAIDLHEGDTINEHAFLALVRAAASIGAAGSATKSRARATGPRLLSGDNPQIAKADGEAPVQAYIAAMSGGGAGWKRDIGRRLDDLITRTVPGVRKAVRWNSPFYGAPEASLAPASQSDIRSSARGRRQPSQASGVSARTQQAVQAARGTSAVQAVPMGWFLSFHCFTKYVKVAFFRGASLRPLPPGESKEKDVRYLDIREGEWPGDALLASWIAQAARQPGWVP